MSHLPVEPEFEQAYKELAATLEESTIFQKNPEYRKTLQVVSIPERVVQFRVVWEDDKGEVSSCGPEVKFFFLKIPAYLTSASGPSQPWISGSV